MLKTREEIKNWLDKYEIKNYTINDDLSVNVDGYVNLYNYDLTEISVQFNKVNDWFGCSCNHLTSLVGSPKIVKGYFSCYSNKITSLIGCPKEVYGDFYCENNELESLKYLSEIHSNLYCDTNLHKTKEYKVYLISRKLKEMV